MDYKNSSTFGFTLIEVIVAMTIMSFMMLGMFSITDNSMNQKESIQVEDRDFLQVYTALNRLQSDFNQVYSPLYYSSFDIKKSGKDTAGRDDYSQDDSGKKFVPTTEFPKATVNGHAVPEIFNDDKTELILFTSANRRKIQDRRESRYLWVRYSLMQEEIDEDDDSEIPKGEFVLVRQMKSSGPFQGETDWDKIKPQVLLRGIKALSFEFWNSKKKDWAERIRELEEHEKFAPRGIRLNIDWIDVVGVERKIIRVLRPSWPAFDVVEDERERQSVDTKTDNRGGDDEDN